jgi:hypothetical protein
MKSILLLIAAVAIAVPSYGALESGDLVVSGTLVQPNPTPAIPALFNVKPDGSIETLSQDSAFAPIGSYNVNPIAAIAVCPDGSIAVARKGNWDGEVTPTPAPWITPVAEGFFKRAAVYKVSQSGTVTKVAEGGDLGPTSTSYDGTTGDIEDIACDSKNNIFVFNGEYPFPTPTPEGNAIVRIQSGEATAKLFASGDSLNNVTGAMTVDSADNILVNQLAYADAPDDTPTPYPAQIFQVSGAGAISTYATAPSVFPYYVMDWYAWSEPFNQLVLTGTDIAGNLIGDGSFIRSPYTAGGGNNILSFGPGGAITTLLDVSGSGGIDLLGANGAYLGFGDSDIYFLRAGSLTKEFIVHGDQTHYFEQVVYYSPEKPQLSVNVSEDVFGRSDSIAFGFGLTRGRTANEADLYFAIQFPASAGGNIKLINPNKAVNKLAPLIDLALAKKYPTQISKLRYGNGTTAVKGSGTVELLKFSNIVIPDGTYTLLGVMTAPGANLFDTSKWLTPNKKAVEAETTYSKAL